MSEQMTSDAARKVVELANKAKYPVMVRCDFGFGISCERYLADDGGYRFRLSVKKDILNGDYDGAAIRHWMQEIVDAWSEQLAAPSPPPPGEPITLIGPEDCKGSYSRSECSFVECPTAGECFQRDYCLKPKPPGDEGDARIKSVPTPASYLQAGEKIGERSYLEDVARRLRNDAGDIGQVGSGVILNLLAALDAATAFKRYVHKWLDEAGVPSDPDPQMNLQTGCRIGCRLAHLLSKLFAAQTELKTATAKVEAMRKALERARHWIRNDLGDAVIVIDDALAQAGEDTNQPRSTEHGKG